MAPRAGAAGIPAQVKGQGWPQRSKSCRKLPQPHPLLHVLHSIQRTFASARDIPDLLDEGTQQERDPSLGLEETTNQDVVR